MEQPTFWFCASNRRVEWVGTKSYKPQVGDELCLSREYFPGLFEGETFETPIWKVERVVHHFDDMHYYGADVYIRNAGKDYQQLKAR